MRNAAASSKKSQGIKQHREVFYIAELQGRRNVSAMRGRVSALREQGRRSPLALQTQSQQPTRNSRTILWGGV